MPWGRRRREVAVALLALAVVWAGLSQVTVSAFSSVTGTPANTLTAASLDPFIPAGVTAVRASATTCTVSWTVSAASGPPGSLTYDVTDGSGTTLATAVSALTTSITIGSPGITPTVKARVGTWVSATARTSASACVAVPDAPAGLSLVAGDQTLVASWTAASGNGSAVTGYTVTASPAGGGAATTCTTTSATTCSLTGLTNGVSYAVSVTASSVNGTGPASATVNGIPISSRPLDAVGSASTAAYSVRRLRAAYAGNAMQVRRASDNTTSTVGFTSNGDLDTAALTTFCASTSCYLRTWYDQSGNSGRDLVQTTTAYQPRIVNAGTVDTANGRPTVIFSGSQQLPTGTSAVSLGGSTVTGNAVGYSSSSSGYSGRFVAFTDSGATYDWDNATSATLLSRRNAGYVGSKRNGVLLTASTADDTLGLFTAIFDGTNHTLYLGSTSATSTASSGSFAATGELSVGAEKDYADNNARLAGAVSEVTVFAAALGSSDRSALASSQQSHYILPSAPTPVSTTPGDGQATITWTAPAVAGASAVSSYTATANPGGQTCTVASPGTTCTVTGLTNGTRYAITVTATNGSGTGAASSSLAVIPRPALLTSTNAQLWLDGTDPDGNDVLAATAENCDTATSCASTSNVLTLWKDKSGKAHDAAQATSAMAGTYSPSNDGVSFSANGYYQATSVPVAPDATAFAVAKSAVTPFNTYGWLVGTRSANGFMLHPQNAATSVKFFGIQGDTFNNQVTNTATVTPTTAITNLHLWDGQISGTTAVSTNLYTDGQAGTTVSATLSGGGIRANASLTLTIGADDLSLASRRGNGTLDEILVFDRALTGTERRTVQDYLARKWSVPITPQAPTALTLTAGDTTATAGWTAPAWDGGSAVTGYTVTAVPTDVTLATRTCTSASNGCSLTGLTDGASYAVTVAATNSLGTGPASTSGTVIPYPATVMSASALKLWLDGADGATMYAASSCTGAAASTTVGCWKDKSSQANNAVQATGGNQPTLATVNARPVPGFTGSHYLTLTPSLLPVGTTSGTTLAVATLTDPAPNSSGLRSVLNYGTLSGGQARQFQKLASSSTRVVSVGTNVTQGTWTSSAGLVAGEYTSSSITIWSDGQQGSTVTGLTNNTGTTYANLGSSGTPSQFWYGQIPEVIALTGVLTPSDRRSVEEYLARKWGITIAPGIPATPTATATNAQAAVSWTAPAWDGGSAITGYTVTASPGGATCTTASTSCTVTGLTNGTAYTFTVAATNAIGTGPASAASAPATPPGPPGIPTALAATAGDTTAALTWTAPATSAPYTGYTATATASGQSTVTCSGASTSCTLTGLVDGVTYTVSVTATNAAGTGSASRSVTVIPYPGLLSGANSVLWLDGADASTEFQDTAKTTPTTAAGQAIAAWKDKSGTSHDVLAPGAVPGTAPTADTSAFSGRTVPAFSSGRYLSRTTGFPTGADYTKFAVYRLTSTGCLNNILSGNGSTHAFYIQATGGLSVWHNGIQVWYGSSTGGAANTPYVGSGTFTNTGLGASVDVNGMPTVSGTVSVTNTSADIQIGAFSGSNGFCGQIAEVAALNKVVTPTERRTVQEYLGRKWAISITPQAPLAATANPGDAQATVSWTAPSWNGGSVVTSYTVTASPGGATCTPSPATNTSCTVTGLTNGTSYTFAVTASNGVGIGPSATTGSVTPVAVPGAPTSVAATAADATSSVSWTAPASNGGSAITSYTATAVPSDGTLATRTCTSASSPCSLTSLTDGVTYTVSVTATNAVGTGSASSAATVIPYPATVMVTGTMASWFDADKSGSLLAPGGGAASPGGKIGTWVDSGSGGLNATQATSANQPTVGSIGSRKAMLSTATTWLTGSSGTWQTVVAVANPNRSATFNTLFASAASTDTSVRIINGTLNTNLNANDWASSTSNQWANSVVSSTADATSTAAVYTAIGSSSRTATFSLSTGFNFSGYRGLDGTMGELVTFNRSLNTSERRTVEEYLARKWSVTIAPAVPLSVTATAGNAQATVSWTAPSWNGGSAVTSYTITASPGGATCTPSPATNTSCTVTGLTNGTSYTFTASATNAIGTGPDSPATSAVTPATVPGAPTGVQAWRSDTTTYVAWAAPSSNGGASITSYTASAVPSSGSTITCSASSSPCELTGLTNGTAYTVSVTATNTAGTGSASSSASSTPRAAQGLYLWGQAASSATSPTQTGATGTQWRQTSTGGALASTTCAIRADWTLWCGGNNTYGTVGDGTTTNRATPVQVGAGTTWVSVSVGGYHSCGVKADGTAWCWGTQTTYGQLGDGTTTQRLSPVQVGAATTWASISAGGQHTCGSRYDRTLWCWGYNFYGQLGQGSTDSSAHSSALQVGSSTTWASLATGTNHSCGTQTDGSLWCWGADGNGQVGDGTTTASRSTALHIGSATTWAGLSGGDLHTCGTRTDGTLWCWGYNVDGRLGDASTTQRTAPVQVGSATTWSGVGAGYNNSCGVRSTGTLWCWGANGSGQLGDGTTTQRTSPVQVGSSTSWTAVSAGYYSSTGLQ